MLSVFKEKSGDYCTACFDGKYPVQSSEMLPDIHQLSLFGEERS